MDESLNTLTLLAIMLIVFPLARAYFARPEWQVPELPQSRIAIFDILRGIAITAVVGIHAVDFYRTALHVDSEWLLFINAVLRFAIPLFLISSGMLLDPRDLQRGIGDFYRRKALRILIPYLVATTAYFAFTEVWSLSALLAHFVRGDILVPYYFVVVLFALYALYPFLLQVASYSWFLPATFALSVTAAVLNFRWLNGVPLPLEFIFFFAYGIAMRPYLARSDVPRIRAWIVFALLYLIAFLVFPAYYYNAMFFWGVAVFVILYSARSRIEKHLHGLTTLGRHSLWIFLIHFPLQQILGELMSEWLASIPLLIGVLLLTLTSLCLSFVAAITLHVVSKRIQTMAEFASR